MSTLLSVQSWKQGGRLHNSVLEEAFMNASVSAKIDALTVPGRLSRSIKLALNCPSKNHYGGVTLHDPEPADLILIDHCAVNRLEIAIDLRPRGDELNIREHFNAIYDFVHLHLFPFDAPGVQESWRGTAADQRGKFTMKTFSNDPDLPGEDGYRIAEFDPTWMMSETAYFGHCYGHSFAALGLPNWAQVKVYFKQEDQGRWLDSNKQSIRIEATIWNEGLAALGIHSVSDLRKPSFSFRKSLSRYFWLLQPDAIKVKPSKAKVPWIRKMIEKARLAFARIDMKGGGVVTLVIPDHRKWVVKSPHTKANRKLGTALDNLTKKMQKT